VGSWIGGVAKAATHDEAVTAPNESCPRLGCKLRGKPSATVSDGCAGKPTRGRAYSGFSRRINRFACYAGCA